MPGKGMKPPKFRSIKNKTIGKGEHKFSTEKSINFMSSELPELKDWKVGEDYTIILKVTQTSTRLEGKEVSASFKINSVGDYTDK